MDLLSTLHREQSLSLSHLIFQQASIGMSLLSLDEHFLKVNEQFCSIVGYSQEELLKMSLQDLLDSDAREAIHTSLSQELSEEKTPPSIVERRGIRKDGTIFWVKLTKSVLRNTSNEPLGFLSLAEDITARRLAEEERERQLESERAAQIAEVRAVTEQYQKEQYILQTFNSLLAQTEILARIPEDIGLSSSKDPTLLHVDDLIRIGQHLTEIITQILNCHSVSIVSLEPPTDKLHFIGMSGIEPQNREAIRKAVEQSSLSDYFDPASITLFHKNKIVMRDLTNEPFVQRPAYLELPIQLSVPMLIGEQLIGLFTINRTASDPPFTSEEIAQVKTVTKLLALIIEHWRLLREWTETRANALALQETNRRFDAFLSIASHELKTPLTGIKASIQLAQRRFRKLVAQTTQIAEHTEVFDHALANIERPLSLTIHRVDAQERLINDLLDATRIRANKLELVMKPCDLVEIVRIAVEVQQQVAFDRTIRCHLPADEHLPVMADADRIGQVVHNYLSNALKYSSPEAPVEVYLEPEETRVRVSVRDNGPGLTAEEQEHIWERFYRAKNIKRQYGSEAGLGLGLHICQTIIKLHHGSVGLHSLPGKGSTFWFTLDRFLQQ